MSPGSALLVTVPADRACVSVARRYPHLVGFDPARHPRGKGGRFAPAASGKVTVRAADGSARTYLIERDPKTGRLVQKLRDAFGAGEGDDHPNE